MNDIKPQLQRRDFLRGALVLGIAAPLAVTLASCAASGSSTPARHGRGEERHEPVRREGQVDGRRHDLQRRLRQRLRDFAAAVMAKQKHGVTAKVSRTNIAQSLQPKFVAGNPPDLVDNSGANAIGISTIRSQLAELSDVIASNNYEGKKIADTLYGGVTKPGTLDGKFLILNYVLTVTRSGTPRPSSRPTAGPCRRRGTRPTSSVSRPRRRASTSSSGARRRRPTTRRSPSRPRSRRAATRSASRSRTSSRSAGPSRPSSPCSRR